VTDFENVKDVEEKDQKIELLKHQLYETCTKLDKLNDEYKDLESECASKTTEMDADRDAIAQQR